MKLIIHLHLMSMSRVRGALPPHLLFSYSVVPKHEIIFTYVAFHRDLTGFDVMKIFVLMCAL
jgi:hypothetical protein